MRRTGVSLVVALFLVVLSAPMIVTAAPIRVPKISEVDFATWKRLASESDKANEVPHENPPYVSRRSPVMAGKPKQGHIVMGKDFTQMRIMWAASGSAVTADVRFGTDEDDLHRYVNGTTKTYKAEDMCGAKDDMDGYSYSVLLTDLKPSTRYYYEFGSTENE